MSYVHVQLRLWRNSILNIRSEIIKLEFMQKYKSIKWTKYKWKNCNQELITSVYVSRINEHNSILLQCTCSALMQSNANADCKNSFEVMANRICTDSRILLHWLHRPLYAFTYGKNNKVSEKQYPGNFSVISSIQFSDIQLDHGCFSHCLRKGCFNKRNFRSAMEKDILRP